jgi:hypothetical protein
LLKEYDVEFDEDLYRRTYLIGEEKVWWDEKVYQEGKVVSGTYLD